VEDRDGLRDRAMQALLDAGIGVGYHYKPAHELAWVRERGWYRPLPHAERIGRTIMSLPLYPGLTEKDVDRVAAALESALRA
jgi:dTDP-4-amino-4,6-dideoxygalactose transaminase